MAHQAYALPWQTLADNFKFVHANASYGRKTNLYPRGKPGQGGQLQYFAKSFARVMDEYSSIERKKYPAECPPPEWNGEIIISDAIMSKIQNVVLEYTKQFLALAGYEGRDPMSFVDRTIYSCIDVSTDTGCQPFDELYETDELLRTLILYGEMEPLFRIAAHPQVNLVKMWTDMGGYGDLAGRGISQLKEAALLAYVCLNVFYLKPELYDPTMRRQMLKEKSKRHAQTLPLEVYEQEVYDYRLTTAYQQMLVFCTGTGGTYPHQGAHKIPHREFYGVPFGMYNASYIPWNIVTPRYHFNHFGTVPLRDLVDKKFPQKYVPSKNDIPVVHKIFRKLPTEIVLMILEFADYTPKGRLNAHADPLHIDNASELKKYLAYCWKLLVRVDMLMKANGTLLDWEYEVAEVIHKLFGVPYPPMSKLVEREEEEWTKFDGERYNMRGWIFSYYKKRVFT
ncbi:hypothetical protein BU24DRAFT_476092 [Aaosphaeria arxii CBS 175.79]|uniref:Uncharacterized protein n=1 Tax=Aaosphaeria arxii CBS 175.79 TaxID=1450172 RepID=A0A6A5Y0J6_9PLEO|nr:uncharacterized protein BU24DRAFT_476092 [Aaosphaeria arxii CBS 175.79]KAF2019058.1 hypothetical protein BU24DRAFT_476092 [Aaosphaeria arxii CBS 175.79]